MTWWALTSGWPPAELVIVARPAPKDAIEAHLTIVFAALAISRRLQDQSGMSIKKIVRALRPIQQITLTIGGHPHTAADPLTDAARDILTATGHEGATH